MYQQVHATASPGKIAEFLTSYYYIVFEVALVHRSSDGLVARGPGSLQNHTYLMKIMP